MRIKWPFVVARLLGEQDWQPFIARYSPEGRPGYAPEPMTGLVVAGIMQGVDTLRALEELARRDLGVMWLTGGICPDHSVIGPLPAAACRELHRCVLRRVDRPGAEGDRLGQLDLGRRRHGDRGGGGARRHARERRP